jgi:tetratricopeptide (TPR) repeat protein
MIITDTAPNKVSSWNRQTYQRLKLAMSLGLRRQIFIAVCDDLSLRNRLAGQLHTELGTTSAQASVDAQGCPPLVSLKLNTNNPNPLAQIAQWFAQNRQPRSSGLTPGFQILGVERLTRQPPSVQRLFLRRLQAIDTNLLRLESSLLLWMPRPWFHTIQQSVPEFWQWHTGIFEFEGEPTPLPPVGASKPEPSPNSAALEETSGTFQEDLRKLLADDLSETESQPPLEPSQPSIASEPPPQEQDEPEVVLPLPAASQKDNSKTQQDTVQEPTAVTISLPFNVWGASIPGNDLGLGELEGELAALEMDEPLGYPPVNTPQPPSEESTSNPPADEDSQPPSSSSPAEAYLELGNYYRHAIEQGNATEDNLMIAIQAYEQALHWLDKSSPQASDILNDLGNLYWMLSRCLGSTEQSLSYLEQAIQAYQLALTKLTAEEAPQAYAMVQNNLGAAYSDLARHQNPAESLEQSIRAYEEALRYRHADTEPLKYASTQNNLGTAHWNLAQHQTPIPHLQAAITAYQEALNHYSPHTEPLNWAMIHNNLGTAYWNLAQYEECDTWLPLAIVSYQEALKYRTAEVAPAACAATQNNLGTAYWHLADRCQDSPSQQAEYLGKCIVAYERAIALTLELSQNTPPIPVNFDVFATSSNLGLAHYQLATGSQFALPKEPKIAHLEAAIEQYAQVCQGVSLQSDSYQTALAYLIKTIRVIYDEGGIAGQNRALSKVPGQLLPEILPRL